MAATKKTTNKSTNKPTSKNTNKSSNKSKKSGGSKSSSKNTKQQKNSSDDTMRFLLVLVIAGIAIALIFFSQKDDRSGGITGMPTPTAEAEVTENPASEPTAGPTETAAPTVEPIQSQPEPENTPEPTAVAKPEPTVAPEPTATTVPTAAPTEEATPTMEPAGILSAKEAYEVLCSYSKEALNISKEVKEYNVEYDEQLTFIEGVDCYRFNLSEFSNGKVRNRGEFYVSVDGTRCYYINNDTNEFIQAVK